MTNKNLGIGFAILVIARIVVAYDYPLLTYMIALAVTGLGSYLLKEIYKMPHSKNYVGAFLLVAGNTISSAIFLFIGLPTELGIAQFDGEIWKPIVSTIDEISAVMIEIGVVLLLTYAIWNIGKSHTPQKG